MNCPAIRTERLLLRPFERRDIDALFAIYSDETANVFLPWFPIRTLEEAIALFEARYARFDGIRYAVCLRESDAPIGYVHVENAPSYDLGYGLRREFWRRGIASKVCRAVVAQARACGIPYLTATHDRNNPHSGYVMRSVGMRYCYSYEEMWQPKNFPVVFRMYQINLDGQARENYSEYWNKYPNHFIEELP